LRENFALIKTEDCLSRNLGAEALNVHLLRRLAEMGSCRVGSQTVLWLDLSDVRKEYAQKMEYLDRVYDGSSGELHQGYWLCEVTAAEVHGSGIVPLYQKLYSTRAVDFHGENAELLGAVDWVGTLVGWRGTYPRRSRAVSSARRAITVCSNSVRNECASTPGRRADRLFPHFGGPRLCQRQSLARPPLHGRLGGLEHLGH
jgi:hypothetical protein